MKSLSRLALSAVGLALALGCGTPAPQVHLDPEVLENQTEFRVQARLEAEEAAREAGELMDKLHGAIEVYEWRDFSEQWRDVSDAYRAAGAQVSADDLDYFLAESWQQRDEINARLGSEKALALDIQAKLRRPGRNMDALARSMRLHQRVNAALGQEDNDRWTKAFEEIASDAGVQAALAYQQANAREPAPPAPSAPEHHGPAAPEHSAPPSPPAVENPGVE